MKRARYHSRLNKKLEDDNKARTDVSRKSLPKKNEQTLVPEITFSEIMPNETMQEPGARIRRSSRLNATLGNSKTETPSMDVAVPESTKDETVSSGTRSASQKVAKASKADRTMEPSADPGEAVNTSENTSPSTPFCDDISGEKSKDGKATPRPETARIEEQETIEVDVEQRVPEGKPEPQTGKSPKKGTPKKASKIPISRDISVKSGASEKQINDAAVNDENDPKNSLLENIPPDGGTAEDLQKQGEEEEEEKPEEVSMRTLRKRKAVKYGLSCTRSKKAVAGKAVAEAKVKEAEKNLVEEGPTISTDGLKECKVVLERTEMPDFAALDEDSQPDPSTANDEADREVSLETLEIRKRIQKKCLGEDASSDEEDRREPNVVNSEKLFDTLIEPAKEKPPTETFDSSSLYQGTIPSRLLSQEITSMGHAEQVGAADDLTERFEAFKQSNSQKTQAATQRQEPIVPSFTMEEDATNDLDEVTNRAITLCMEEDSDADLDVVMKSKSRKSAAVGNTMIDPVYCDIGTSMSIPADQKDPESLVLMIDSTSRESSENRQTQPEFVMRICGVESVCKAPESNDFVSEGDQGEELKNPRKSKLQSTLLPSPKLHADIAVGTGPSLMATIPETETIKDEQFEPIVIEDDTQDIEGPQPASEACDRNEEAVQQDIEHREDLVENAPASENQGGERMREEFRPDAETVEASPRFEASPKLLQVLNDRGRLPSDEDAYETDEVFSDEEIVAEREIDARKEDRGQDERKEEEQATREKDAEDRQEEQEEEYGSGDKEKETAAKVTSAVVDDLGVDPKESPIKISRARCSSEHGFLLQEQSLQSQANFLKGMDDLPLLDMIGDNLDAFDLPEFTPISSQNLSERSSRRGRSRDETPRLLLQKETPKSKAPLSADHRVGRDIHKGGKKETPLSLFREIRKPRLSRRTLFDDAADVPPDLLPNLASANSVVTSSAEKRRKTFALDSTRLPNFDDAYVVAEFDARELKKRGEELFQLAARNLLDMNPEYRGSIQHAFEDLLTTLQEPMKRMMGLLVKKYALKEACEARKESYLNTQTRLARTRKYITDTANKLMPGDECNAVKVFGFNPFEFKDPPPETVREINKRKALEDEERLKKKFRLS